MEKNRLEAFSDGVLAIIITIMVLELKPPHGASWEALRELQPVFLSYILSFMYVGIYWNNHHHLLQAVKHVKGSVLWANLHLLFWLSLVPFATAWMGENQFQNFTVAIYGFVLLMSGLAFVLLTKILVHYEGSTSDLALAVGRDYKGKVSLVLYPLGIALSLVNRWLALAVYVAVAIMWFVPDSRIERKLGSEN